MAASAQVTEPGFDFLIDRANRDLMADMVGSNLAEELIELAHDVYRQKFSPPFAHLMAPKIVGLNEALREHLMEIHQLRQLRANRYLSLKSALKYHISMISVFV